MTKHEQQISIYHQVYQQLTGYQIALNYSRKAVWHQWLTFRGPEPKDHFTTDDLRAVIKYLRAEIRGDRRNEGALKFHNLIGSPDFFEEDLALAKKHKFHKTAPPKMANAQYVQETRSPEQVQADYDQQRQRERAQLDRQHQEPNHNPNLPPDAFKSLKDELEK